MRRRLALAAARWGRNDPCTALDGPDYAWRPPPPCAELVQRCHQALLNMPVGYLVRQRAWERRESLRRRRVLAGKTTDAPHGHQERDLQTAARWMQESLQATARGWAQLRVARGCRPLPGLGTLLGHLGPSVPTRAGAMLGSSFGTQQGNSEAVIDCLEQAYLTLTPQRGVIMPWMHWVGAYGGKSVRDGQLGHDAMSVMHGMGVDPRQHLWALFGHDHHWHLVLSRVREDGRTFTIRRMGLALRTTVDVLDAESGCQTGYRPACERRAQAANDIRQDQLCAELIGRDAAGATTIEQVPLQGPAWAARVAPLGAYPDRVCGLLVLPKPSYRHVDAIVRHCIDT